MSDRSLPVGPQPPQPPPYPIYLEKTLTNSRILSKILGTSPFIELALPSPIVYAQSERR